VKVNLHKEQWVRYTEFATWQKDDKHNQAFAILLNDRSKKMGKILGTEVERDKRCLACHTGYPVNKMPPDEKGKSESLVSAKILDEIEITFGVTCEGCHGPSQGTRGMEKKGWLGPHQEPDSWRFLAPETKRKDFGFWDVRSPASRTRICASCHIGSVELGRVVTHEMYAAGHPPLPGFEVESFIHQMPVHWNPFVNKSNEVVERFVKNTKDPLYADGQYKKENLHRTSALLIGALVSASEYFRLIGDLNDPKGKEPATGTRWPELALFDCYACHHELKGPSWRQVRKPPAGIPGRPFLQEWNTVLVDVALSQLGDAPATYKKKYDAIRDALNKQPFGNRDLLKKSTLDAADWLYARALELELKPIPPMKGPAIMKDLVWLASAEIQDYESARKYVWGLEVVDAELKRLGKNKIANIMNPAGKELFLLDLRSGREVRVAVPGEAEKSKVIEVHLEKVMPFFGNYDPTLFRERIFEIGKMLK